MSLQIERINEEIEALEAILMDDVLIGYNDTGVPELVTITIFPSTANDIEKQYVCVTFEASLPKLYPDCEPIIKLKNPRGLDDSVLEYLYIAMKNKCIEFIGQPVIYELIELVRENLTKSNLPTCQCAICLYGFSEGDSFTKTKCFHYFHSYCLSKHLFITEKFFNEEQEKLPAWQKCTKGFQAVCPVCREPINISISDLKNASPPKDLETAQNFSVTQELKSLQTQMKELFLYQKKKGGIIDVEEEENKLLLITNSEDDVNEDPGPSLVQVDEDSVKSTPVNHKIKPNFCSTTSR